MALIPLAGGAFAIVDDADFAWLNEWKWHRGGARRAYARRCGPRPRQRVIYMHRVILGLEPGDSREADHRNGNKLDNRRSNLRVVTHAENQQNFPALGGTSRHRGVCWQSRGGRWRAEVQLGGRHYHVGLFHTEDEAAKAASAFRVAHMPFAVEAA